MPAARSRGCEGGLLHRLQGPVRPCLFQAQIRRTAAQRKGHELVAEPRAARLAPLDRRVGAVAVPGEAAAQAAGDGAPGEAEADAYVRGDGVVDGGAGELEDPRTQGACRPL